MNTKKFLLAALAGGVGQSIAYAILEVGLLRDYLVTNIYNATGASVTGEGSFPFWVGLLAIILVMAYIYPKGYEGGSPAYEGLRFGVLLGLFSGVPFGVFFDNMFPIGAIPALVFMLTYTAEIALAGLFIGLVYGKE